MAAAGEPWIKVERSLARDPRIVAMARALQAREQAAGAPETPFARLCITCVGAVCILWITADAYVGQDDVLRYGPADIDELTGIESFCELMPPEWLVVLDAKSVKLPNFHTHNGALEKKRAQQRKRQQRHRNAHA